MNAPAGPYIQENHSILADENGIQGYLPQEDSYRTYPLPEYVGDFAFEDFDKVSEWSYLNYLRSHDDMT